MLLLSFFKDKKNKAQKYKKCPLCHTVNKGWIWDLSPSMSIFISRTVLSPLQRSICVTM